LPGSVLTVGGNLSLTGAENDLLNLSATGSWTLNVTGTATADYVQARYGDASGGNMVTATHSTDKGHNKHWNFNLGDWNYNKRITVPHTYVDEDLHDFPILVRLAADASVGANAQSSGADIRFATATGMNLAYEREDFRVRVGSGSGNFWVRVPTVYGAQNTEIFLYYGNSQAGDGQWAEEVWDDNFKGVWHLPNGTVLNATDATVNQYNGSITGATAAGGMVDGAGSFGGSSFTSHGNTTSLSVSNLTVSAWVKRNSETLNLETLVGKSTGGGADGFYLAVYQNRIRMQTNSTAVGTSTRNGTSTLNQNTWYHLTGVYNAAGSILTYVNGTAENGSDVGPQVGWQDPQLYTLNLGARTNGTNDFLNGYLDEVRISSAARSAAWVKFEYWNMLGGETNIGNPSNQTITGKFSGDEGVTGLSGKMVTVSLNGGATVWSDATDAGGQFAVTNLPSMTGGTVVTVYADGNTEKAVTVTLGDGGSMTGIHLYQDRLVVKSDSGSSAV
ncbi:MAG: DUF2341 domain-containing protein, partial [Patescibacteria group bacterium]